MRNNPFDAIALALVVVCTLAPIWSSAPPVTQDGASHLYNAAIVTGVSRGQEPFVSHFVVDPHVRPNETSQRILIALGGSFGWEFAERALLTMASIALLVTLILIVGVRSLAILFCGWLVSNWFLWMGFFDFALSLPVFVALFHLGTSASEWRGLRVLSIELLLALLYFTHLFTFAIGVGILACELLWLLQIPSSRREGFRRALFLAPAAGLLLIEVLTGHASQRFVWTNVSSRLLDAVTGDFVITVIGPDTVVGVLLTLALVMWAVGRRRQLLSRRAALGILAVGLFAASLIVPDGVGEGGYIPVRMRMLSVLLLLPALGAELGLLGQRWSNVAAVSLATLLVWRTTLLYRQGIVMREQRVIVTELLSRSGAYENNGWVVARLPFARVWPIRVGVFRHMAEGVAVGRTALVLDNYEALYNIFGVSWQRRPDWLFLQPTGTTLAATLVPGDTQWPGLLYVIHDSAHRLAIADNRLALGATAVEGQYAVTTVRRIR